MVMSQERYCEHPACIYCESTNMSVKGDIGDSKTGEGFSLLIGCNKCNGIWWEVFRPTLWDTYGLVGFEIPV